MSTTEQNGHEESALEVQAERLPAKPEFTVTEAQLSEAVAASRPLLREGQEVALIVAEIVDDVPACIAVHEARLVAKRMRVAIEAKRKELKEDALRYGRVVDGEAKRLKGIIEPTEERLLAIESGVDAEIERRKAELEKQKGERFKARLAQLVQLGEGVDDPAELMEESEADFENRVLVAREAHERREAEAAETRRIATEAAQAVADERAQEEQRAAAERAREEARLAEMRAQLEEERRALAEERKLLDAERAERERVEQAREAALREVQEREEAERLEKKREAQRRADAESWAAAQPDRDRTRAYAEFLRRSVSDEGCPNCGAWDDLVRSIVLCAVREIEVLVSEEEAS